MLLLREPDNVVVQASANAAAFLGAARPICSGRSLEEIPGDLAERLRPHLPDPLHEIVRGIRCHVGRPHDAFDCLIHRPPGGGLIIELERAGPAVDLSPPSGDRRCRRSWPPPPCAALCDETARIFKDLTGYDRVMVYRFDDEGHGEVFAEAREPELEAVPRQPLPGLRHSADRAPAV